MHGKWRGTVTLWNSWQNKEPTLGKWLYLWFHIDRWRYQEGGKSEAFVTVQSVKWCDVWQRTRALTLRMSASGVKTWEVICSCLSAVLLLVLDMHMMDQDINPCSGMEIYFFRGFYMFFKIWAKAEEGESVCLLHSRVFATAPPSCSSTALNPRGVVPHRYTGNPYQTTRKTLGELGLAPSRHLETEL